MRETLRAATAYKATKHGLFSQELDRVSESGTDLHARQVVPDRHKNPADMRRHVLRQIHA
jgi:hypothetical protein